ncbi:MAG TPA: Stp1/IreP family PP2C-type Ser/Thr phosphatase [Candidatus Cloacimonadota bacterium]|nr:Stp1/IreP family PP2C-type Ser/Thr phosphatase [Candidatus Cloacimonadota bacterium]
MPVTNETGHARYIYGNRSDIGMVREKNQDYFGKYSGAFGELIIVCDGMGGYEGGEIASQIAVETIAGHFANLGSTYDEKGELRQSLLYAEQNIADYKESHPEVADMGTTAVLLLIKQNRFWYAWVGDSRLYLVRAGKIQRLSRDHSYVQGLLDHGIITEDQAREHPKKNVITKALGANDSQPDIAGPFSLYEEDKLMLCSDGLYGYFSDEEILQSMLQEPQEACNQLVEMAKQRGGDDNITIQIVKSNVGGEAPKSVHPQGYNLTSLILIGITIILLISVTGIGVSLYHRSRKDKAKIEEDSAKAKKAKPSSGEESLSTEDLENSEDVAKSVQAENELTKAEKQKIIDDRKKRAEAQRKAAQKAHEDSLKQAEATAKTGE